MTILKQIACGFLTLLLLGTAAQAQSTTTTLSGLPNVDTPDGPAARIDALTVVLRPLDGTVTGQRGASVGWGFDLSWASNAGDSIAITSTSLTGDYSVFSASYRDLLGDRGGPSNGVLAAGQTWSEDFVDGATGLGSIVVRPGIAPGAEYLGTVRVDFAVYAGPAQSLDLLGNYSIDVPVRIAADPGIALPAQPADQVLTFDPIADQPLSSPPFTISASSSGRLPVSFVSETAGVCTVSDTVVTLQSAGTCTITASQEGDASFNAAWPASQSFAVTKTAATVAITGSTTQTYDGSPKSLSVTTTPAGLNVLLSYNGETEAPAAAGTYSVSAVIQEANYEGTAAATLTIARSALAISWPAPAAITYGAALTATQLNATANTAGTFAYQPAAGARLNAGAQTLTATFTPADGAQFDVGTVTVPLTVDKAVLTVSGPVLTREFGAANPALLPAYGGFAAGDTVANLTGAPSLTVAATTASQPGSYPISVTAGSLASPNYSFAPVNGSLTVVDTTGPVLTLPAGLTATAYREEGTVVTYTATSADAVDGSRAVTCAPASGSVFAPGATRVTCDAVDSRGNRSTGGFDVAVTLADNRIGRFVAFSRELTLLRANTTVVTGDVGANERRQHPHRREDDDHEEDERSRTDVTVRIGERVSMQQASSRVVGDTVRLLSRASVYDVVGNLLFTRRATVLGEVTTPMTPVPYLAMPVMPAITAGAATVTVRRNQTFVLAAGAYGDVRVESGATLVLTGGLYQVRSLGVGQNATIRFRAATELRIKTDLDTAAKARLILDPGVTGLRASQMVIYVEGTDETGRRGDRDDDGDDHGASAVSLGSENRVQANIYAPNGTIWMRSRMQGTGAFIGAHLRVGQQSTLTLDSAFK